MTKSGGAKHLRELGLIVCGVAVIAVSSNDARAWGQNGHRIVGEIAQARLSSKARNKIREYIGGESLARASTFMDEVKSDPNREYYATFANWHFINVPVGTPVTEYEHPPGGDALMAMETFEATLKNPAAAPIKKAEAIRFLTHVIGDIHQPLHANAPGDQGANWCMVKWFGERKNLHSVWDSAMVDYLQLSFTEHTRFIEQSTTHAQRAEWARGTYADWITESNSVSASLYPPSVGEAPAGARTYCKTASTDVIEDTKMPALSYDYHYQHRPLMDRRLMQGGIRLAMTLNRIFEARPATAQSASKAAARVPATQGAIQVSEHEQH